MRACESSLTQMTHGQSVPLRALEQLNFNNDDHIRRPADRTSYQDYRCSDISLPRATHIITEFWPFDTGLLSSYNCRHHIEEADVYIAPGLS